MKISVMGLGYVGAVAAACLAKDGHEVIGVDPQQTKVDLVNAGRTPIIEKDIGEIIAEQVASGRLVATTDVKSAVAVTDLSLVCVGTPSLGNGHIDLKYIRRVCEQIGEGLREHRGHTVVLRSTLLPGSMKDVVIPTLEAASGLRAGVDFGLSIKPGFAFGGSCLPKDVRALAYKAKLLDVKVPIIDAILPSNDEQIERGIRAVTEKASKKVGILGFSFKAGTDDLRESPMVELVERLIGKGYDLRVYDSNVRIASIVGANRDYILNHIPHISKLMVNSIDEVLDHADTVVIGNGSPEFREVPKLLRENQQIVDLVRISDTKSVEGVYDGICW